jgi:hypothetical protein
MMADEPKQPIVTDPDNVPEILCDGQFNIFVNGQFATLTFTHVRPDSTSMFRGGAIDQIATVRARIETQAPQCPPPVALNIESLIGIPHKLLWLRLSARLRGHLCQPT